MTNRSGPRRRLDALRGQWRTATAAGDHARAAQIETTARQIQADLDQPEPAPPAKPATVHGWWLVSATPMHRGCGACRRAPGGPDCPARQMARGATNSGQRRCDSVDDRLAESEHDHPIALPHAFEDHVPNWKGGHRG